MSEPSTEKLASAIADALFGSTQKERDAERDEFNRRCDELEARYRKLIAERERQNLSRGQASA